MLAAKAKEVIELGQLPQCNELPKAVSCYGIYIRVFTDFLTEACSPKASMAMATWLSGLQSISLVKQLSST